MVACESWAKLIRVSAGRYTSNSIIISQYCHQIGSKVFNFNYICNVGRNDISMGEARQNLICIWIGGNHKPCLNTQWGFQATMLCQPSIDCNADGKTLYISGVVLYSFIVLYSFGYSTFAITICDQIWKNPASTHTIISNLRFH